MVNKINTINPEWVEYKNGGNMKKIITIIIVLLMGVLLNAKSYSSKDFFDEINTANTDKQKFETAKEFFLQSEDINVQRQATDYMERLGFFKECEEILLKYRNENPDNKEAIYLLGRIQDSKSKIVIGRKLVKAHPDWEYGYRLLLATYDQMFLFKKGKILDSLSYYYNLDKDYFTSFYKMKVKDNYNKRIYFKFNMYEKKYDTAMKVLEKARKSNEKWVNDELFAQVYLFQEEYEKAYDLIFEQIKKREQIEDETIALRTVYSLDRLCNQYNNPTLALQLLDYFKDKWSKVDLYSQKASTYAKLKDETNTLKFLKLATNEGFDMFDYLIGADEFEFIQNTPKFETILLSVKSNWASNAKKRKESALKQEIKKETPKTKLLDSEQNEFSLESMKGNILVLDFWATWCGPCKMAMPKLSAFAEKTGNKVKVISVNVWERDPKKAISFFKENNYKMELAFADKKVTEDFGITGIPYICVIDTKGIIRFEAKGYSSSLDENLHTWIDYLSKSK